MIKRSKQKTAPTPRGMYAFTKYRRGDFLIFLGTEKEDDIFEFMQLPSMFSISLTKQEFNSSLDTGIIEYVECLPEDVFEVCICNVQK